MSSEADLSKMHPKLILSSSQKAHRFLFTKLRDTSTSPADFVKYSQRSMRLLAEDALAEFATTRVTVSTPCGNWSQGLTGPDPSSIVAVSIIRSGDALLEAVRYVEPDVRVGKILIQRDEDHPMKLPTLFYCKLPPEMHDDNKSDKNSPMKVLLCDPMLATGGSAILALDVLTQAPYNVSPSDIVFANMICAPEGLQAMAAKYPDVTIVTAQIDECLNEDKFIVPGLGDYGDRFFNT
ncbi:uracil phosphoribosyltransferase [Nitzschia inconspicua]|uniref:uracil phosphoribosyltransferase n=1 Tax=Nitzschia inconspicua TaxID=303405 RepID=A0A9K3L9L7_9STRA|nr:uracil phosphoribosyltransferase [Nitzschia inconspicua]